MGDTRRRLAEARRALHESLVLHSAPEADRIRGLIALLEEAVRDDALNGDICEIPHLTVEEEEECERGRTTGSLRQQVDEARMWARHGYEIGQRHCGWTDYGTAPAWLTDGWPPHFRSCPNLEPDDGV